MTTSKNITLKQYEIALSMVNNDITEMEYVENLEWDSNGNYFFNLMSFDSEERLVDVNVFLNKDGSRK